MNHLSIKPIPDFDKLGNNAYLLVLALILFIEIIVFKNYFFEKVYCSLSQGADAYVQYYPFEYHTADYIAKYGIPKWSFSVGMGQNLFQFVLHDPFDIFFYYLPGKDYILYCRLYKELAKILLCGLIFFFYLKTLKLSNYTSLIGSLLFAFCSFVIVAGGVWYMFSFEAFNLALLLLAFELLFSKQKWHLFPIAVFLIGVSMPFNLYLYGFFLACYAVLRHLQTGAFNFKKLGALFLKMAGLGMVGLLLSGPFLIENTLGLFESPRVNGGSSLVSSLSSAPVFGVIDKFQLGTCVMRFFSSDMLGSENAFKGWLDYLDAPEFYCGLPCLLLMPQVFQFLDKRVRLVFIVFLTLWLLPLIFPYFRQAFWLFTADYYRTYSFFVSLVFLYYSLLALEFIVQQKKINRVVLISTMVVLFVLINYPFFNTDIINHHVSFFVMGILIVYGLILYLIPKQKNPVYLKWVFLVAVAGELIYLSAISVNGKDVYTYSDLSQKKGYNDYTVDAVNYIKQNDKTFYRIDKSYPSGHFISARSLDDGMAQGYYGTSCFSSFNQEYYINYLELMGLINKNDEWSTRFARGLFPYHILEAENSVKYILTHTMNPSLPVYFDSLTQVGNVKILRNKFALPMGYTYTYFMKESSFNLLSFNQKNFVSIRTCVIKDGDVNKVSGLKDFDLNYTGSIGTVNWQEDFKALKNDTLAINQFSQNFIIGSINVNEDKIMYLSIPYDAGWKLKVDGQPTDKIILNGGMTGVMLKKGNHTIELNYDLPFFNIGLLMSLLGILIYLGFWFYTSKR